MVIYDINGNQLSGGVSASNCLSGKSLCCAGDSLTEGTGIKTEYPSETSRPTYGRVCAELNGMTFVNAGSGGSTIANISVKGTFRNGFSVDRYKNIGEKDYLVLWFGFNDFRYGAESLKDVYCQENYSAYYQDCTSEQKASCDAVKDWNTAFVGDIDSTDNTTWCGAWNTVLTYLTQTYPDMHVGVILPIVTTEALKDPMRDALITICKKHGVPYIDSMNSNEWCSFGFTEGLSDTMEAFYLANRTGDGYLHPNERAYRIMANQLTEFLCRI